MSDLERDINKARIERENHTEYSAASLEDIRRKAAKIYQEYEEEMERRAMQEVVNDYKHHLYS